MNALFVLSFVGLIPGQSVAPLRVREPIVDRGEVKAGVPLTQKFELRNGGSTPIAITDVAVGCGCLKPRLSVREIAPGGAAELTIDINTLAQATGPNSWKATIRYRQGKQPLEEMELHVKAKVLREITVEPVGLAITIERETTHAITVTDRRNKPFTISEARSTSKHIKTELSAAGVNERGERVQQVRIAILDSFPAGHAVETLLLITDDKQYQELRVPIVVTRKAPGQVVATPEQLDLRLVEGQTSASGLIRLRDPDDRAVVVDRVESDHAAIRFKWAAGPGAMTTLRLGVEFDGNYSSGIANVKVHLKEPQPQVIIIPLSWQK